MPIYEYDCETCKARFEVIQKMDDPPLEKKEGCSENCTLQKTFSTYGMNFVGNGFYVNDYKGK